MGTSQDAGASASQILILRRTVLAKRFSLRSTRYESAVRDWLLTEFAVDKPTQKLADVAGLDADGLVAEVKKVRGRQRPLTVADVRRLKEEHATTVLPMQAKARAATALETRLSDLVNEAYGLTPDDVALMWATAPPRMPGGEPKKEAQ